MSRLCSTRTLLCVWTLATAAPVFASEPWRLQDAVGAPEWLTLGGEARVRFESLDGQFRRGRQGSDQLLVLRTLLDAAVHLPRGRIGVELADARAYGSDAAVNNGIVNTTDVLQLFYELPFDLAGASARAKAGRFTMSMARRRIIGRQVFRNTINAFSGVHARAVWAGEGAVDAFYVVPVGRLPVDPRRAAANDFELDEEQWKRRYFGMQISRLGVLPGLHGDAFVYALREQSSPSVPTPERKVTDIGFRLWRARGVGEWDFDLETSFRFGTQRRDVQTGDRADVRAHMLHAELGRTFGNANWLLRLSAQYERASGDEDPFDGTYERYDNLFGVTRPDLGHTGIYRALTRANISTAGLRVSFAAGRWDATLLMQRPRLAANRDAWVPAMLRDSTGEAGRSIGTALDGFVRYWLVAGSLRVEIGGSALWFGRFPREVPGGPQAERSLYGYGQLSLVF